MGVRDWIADQGNRVQTVIGAALDTATGLSQLAIGIPLPSNVVPLIIPLASLGEGDPGWAASSANRYTPMSFYLNINRNLNPIAYAAAAAATAAGNIAGADNFSNVGTRGVVDSLPGGGKKITQLQNNPNTSFLPIDVTGGDAARAALRQIFVPPLTMLINPSNINFMHSKDINSYAVKGGVVTEYIGNSLTRITANGTSPGFYTKNYGLSRMKRTQSLGFQNLMSLYFVYRNNGNDYLQYANNTISIVGAVTMFYDGNFYIGSFRNFNITEESSSPFRLNYSFNFTVRMRIRSLLSDISSIAPFPLLDGSIFSTLGTI